MQATEGKVLKTEKKIFDSFKEALDHLNKLGEEKIVRLSSLIRLGASDKFEAEYFWYE